MPSRACADLSTSSHAGITSNKIAKILRCSPASSSLARLLAPLARFSKLPFVLSSSLPCSRRLPFQIEVVKCRAQAESFGKDGKKLGSFKISQKIWQTDGPRGFYIGGLMTACRDGISSGIFFWGCTRPSIVRLSFADAPRVRRFRFPAAITRRTSLHSLHSPTRIIINNISRRTFNTRLRRLPRRQAQQG